MVSVLVLGFLVMAAPATVSAQGRSRVAVVRPADADALLAEAATRVSAELVALGFEVVFVESDGADGHDSVMAAHLGSPPVVTLALSSDGADVWLEGDEPVPPPRHVDVSDVTSDRAASVLAVRAVELVRATLLERALAASKPAEKPPEESAPPAPKPNPEEREPEDPSVGSARARSALRVELGAGVLSGVRSAGVAFAPVLRAGYGTDQLTGRLSVIAPAFGAEVAGAAGSAALREELAVVEVLTRFPRNARLSAVLSAGGGLAHAHVGGEADAPFTGDSGDSWALVGIASAGASLHLAERTGLSLEGSALFRTPTFAVRVGDDEFRSRTPELLGTLAVWEAF